MKKPFLRGVGVLCGIALTVLLSAPAFAAELTAAKVTATELNFRKGAGTDYEVITLIEQGTVVAVESTVKGWSHVWYNGQWGYVSSGYLDPLDEAALSLGSGTLTGDMVRFRESPSLAAATIAKLQTGDVVEIIGISGEWYRARWQGQEGYLYSSYVSLDPAGIVPASPVQSGGEDGGKTPGASLERDPGTVPGQESAASEAAAAAVKTAQGLLGSVYVYGGAAPGTGFDCSGLVQYCFAQNGVSLERTASAQYREGTKIEKSELLPGDLVFFAGTRGWYVDHVGIYIGNGSFIHSSSGKAKVVVAELDNVYFDRYYYGACRVGG